MASHNLDLLKQVREADEQKEVLKDPENKSLHPDRIRQYLEENEIDAENFERKFNFDAALDILRMKKTRGEVKLERELLAARDFLDEIDVKGLLDETGSELMSERDPSVFESSLKKLLLARGKEDQEEKVLKAHEKYLLIRNLAYRRVQILKQFEVKREEETKEVTAGLKEGFAKKVEEVKKNFKNMSTAEKAVAVGAVVFSAVWLFSQSDNPRVQRMKEHVWKGLKLVGAGVGVNYAWKLFTGKTAIAALGDWSKETAGSQTFWKETFDTDAKHAEMLQKSTIYMGDKDILDLAKRYRDAKAAKKEEVRITSVAESDMSSKDIYFALDTFFKRYPVEKVEKKYQKEDKDARRWDAVIATELAVDNRLEYKEDVGSRMYDSVRSGFYNGYNWMISYGGLGLSREIYKWKWGKEGSDAEIKEWVEQNGQNVVDDEAGLKRHLEKTTRHRSAKNYQDVIDHGHREKGVKFLEVTGDSVYIMSEVGIVNLGANEKDVAKAWIKAQKQVEDFLKKRFPDHKENINKYIVAETGAGMVNPPRFVQFARMPLPGTPEYHALNTGERSPEEMIEERELHIFKGDLRYNDFQKWEQDKLRIHYGLDASQDKDIEKIMEEISRRYKPLGLPILKVKQDVLEDEELRDEVLEKAGVTPKLRGNSALLEDIDEIEKDAAADIKGKEENYARIIDELKRTRGYKVRLAILGDKEARKALNYDPSKEDAYEDLKDKYTEICEQYVKVRNQGT